MAQQDEERLDRAMEAIRNVLRVHLPECVQSDYFGELHLVCTFQKGCMNLLNAGKKRSYKVSAAG